jgi:hypothetical protein
MNMNNSSSNIGMRVLLAALGLGVLGDALLRGTPWGVNLGLWILLLLIGVTALAGSRATWRRPMPRLLTVAMLVFAGGFAWRDSAVLLSLDALGLAVSAGLLVWQNRGGQLSQAGFADCVEGMAKAGGRVVIGLPQLLARDIAWAGVSQSGGLRQVPAVIAGVAISLPLVMLFGGLFVAADAAYRRMVTGLIPLNFGTWVSHLGTWGMITWIAAGYLRSTALGSEAPPRLPRARRFSGLGQVELGTLLGVLNLLFLTFVLVQFRYLFGGAARVEQTLGVTYSEYAREGFFQLVAVACLVLPLLWVLDWLRNPAEAPGRFRFLALTMIVLLGVIMVSAFHRMRLYQLEFGLTELRFHTTAFMLWLAAVLAWFAFTVLRGQRNRFVSGALATAFAAVFALHLVNPDAWMVRTNVAHAARSARPFDTQYATSLSADALPTLLAALPGLPAETQAELRLRLTQRWNSQGKPDWRSWNWSRARGADSLGRAGIQ